MSMSDGQNDGGGGGGLGTAGSICTISPEDTEAVLGNLISRIEKIEFNLSQILGANLNASQLSDISSQVGWVYGVEYMGIPGWIQTEYGTLIPPPGFTLLGSGITLSDGNTYQAVLMDSDGVLQYGFSNTGQISGASASLNDYYIYSESGGGGGAGSDPWQVHARDITEITNTLSTVYSTTPFVTQVLTLQTTSPGMYLVSAYATNRIYNVTGSADASIHISVYSSDAGGIRLDAESSMVRLGNEPFNRCTTNGTWGIRMNANDTISISITPGLVGTGSAANYSVSGIVISLVWVSQLT